MKLPQDEIFTIICASPFLDAVEETLRTLGQNALAGRLLKLQQDAGVAYDQEERGDQGAPGYESAMLRAAYEDVTTERFEIFKAIQNFLPEDHSLQSGLQDFLDQFDHDKLPDSNPSFHKTIGRLDNE